jgi:RimJ/RimL family protein N-acetyltransferase
MPVLPESLTLREGAVVLRSWREQDSPVLKSVCGDPDVCQFTSVPWAYTPSAARAWVGRIQERRSSGTGLALAVTRERDDVALGNVNLVRFNDDDHEAALGYWLVPAARGQGLAAKAARMLCAWGAERMQLKRIELAILPGNVASQAVAERLGAVREGVRLERHEAGGSTWNMVIYAVNASRL